MSRVWRAARCLTELRDQVNKAHPGRSKVSDGIIGDAAHAAAGGGHNPDHLGVVRAMDLTNDPAHGMDTWALAQALIDSRDSRILYVIARGRICSSVVAPWTWRTYSGSDPHTSHLHLEVVSQQEADNPRPWNISSTINQKAAADMDATQDQRLKHVETMLARICFGLDNGDPNPYSSRGEIPTRLRDIDKHTVGGPPRVDAIAAAVVKLLKEQA